MNWSCEKLSNKVDSINNNVNWLVPFEALINIWVKINFKINDEFKRGNKQNFLKISKIDYKYNFHYSDFINFSLKYIPEKSICQHFSQDLFKHSELEKN